VRPGRDADHSPPSCAEVKYEYELYLLSPHVPPWRVARQLYFFTLYIMKMENSRDREQNFYKVNSVSMLTYKTECGSQVFVFPDDVFKCE
jgi:hypothetical protein